jgi:hypothetical protein
VCKHTESGNLLSVLDQLDPDTLANGGVGLLGLNTDLLEDDALGVGRATEWGGLESRSEGALLKGQIGPSLLAAVVLELASGVKTTRLSFTHDCCTSRRLANIFNFVRLLAGFRRGGFVARRRSKGFCRRE